jgi:hypothetical protein
LAFLGLKSAGTTQLNIRNIENFINREGKRAELTRNKALKGEVSEFMSSDTDLTDEEKIEEILGR